MRQNVVSIFALVTTAACVSSGSAIPIAPPSKPPVIAPPISVPPPATQVPLRPADTLAATPRLIDRLPEGFAHGGRERDASEIDLIVIHTIGGATCVDGAPQFGVATGSAVFWRDWFAQQNDKSIHYVIDREGAIAQQRPDLRTAGHVSFHGVIERVIDRAIGIELVNRGDGIDPFPEAQIDAVKWLVADLSARYNIASDRLVTHEALDPRMQPLCGGKLLRRNVDPGPLFPLEDVRAAM